MPAPCCRALLARSQKSVTHSSVFHCCHRLILGPWRSPNLARQMPGQRRSRVPHSSRRHFCHHAAPVALHQVRQRRGSGLPRQRSRGLAAARHPGSETGVARIGVLQDRARGRSDHAMPAGSGPHYNPNALLASLTNPRNRVTADEQCAQKTRDRSDRNSGRNTPFPSETFPANPSRDDGAITCVGRLLRFPSVLACWRLTSGRWRQHFRCFSAAVWERSWSPSPGCLVVRRRNQNKRPVRASALAGFPMMPCN